MPVFSALSQFLSLLKMYVFSSCPYCESQLTFLPSFKANKVPVNIQIAIMITKKKKKSLPLAHLKKTCCTVSGVSRLVHLLTIPTGISLFLSLSLSANRMFVSQWNCRHKTDRQIAELWRALLPQR